MTCQPTPGSAVSSPLLEHDQPALPWAARIPPGSTGRRNRNDGDAGALAGLCGGDSLTQPPDSIGIIPILTARATKQTLDGMSGAIVIEGVEQYAPKCAVCGSAFWCSRRCDFVEGRSRFDDHRQASGDVPGRVRASPSEPRIRAFTVNGRSVPRSLLHPVKAVLADCKRITGPVRGICRSIRVNWRLRRSTHAAGFPRPDAPYEERRPYPGFPLRVESKHCYPDQRPDNAHPCALAVSTRGRRGFESGHGVGGPDRGF